MFDPTFGSASLARQFTKNDFLKQPNLKNDAHKNAIITQAVTIAREGFTTSPLTPNVLAGRTIYQVNDLPANLVLRKAAQNIRQITGAEQGSRMQMDSSKNLPIVAVS